MYESIEGWNTTVPDAGRIYDHLLGGASNFKSDREAAEDILTALPQARSIARANRAFLTSVVRHLLDLGIRQFLDIGSGICAVQPIHEIAVDARIVYVDRDPTAVAHNTFALYNRWDATAVRCDLRYPDDLLSNDGVREMIDFDQPVALLLMAVLQFVADSDAYPRGRHLARCPGSRQLPRPVASRRDSSRRRVQRLDCPGVPARPLRS